MSTFGYLPVEKIPGQLDLDDVGDAGRRLQSPAGPPRPPPSGLRENKWQEQVVQLAQLYRWLVYHTYDSRRSNPGWPDLVLCRPPELLVVELKTDTGRLSVAQRDWLDALTACGVETHVWRPYDFDAVHDRLKRRAA